MPGIGLQVIMHKLLQYPVWKPQHILWESIIHISLIIRTEQFTVRMRLTHTTFEI